MIGPDEIRSTMHRYIECLCRSDVDGLMELFAVEATVEDPVGGPIHSGPEAIRALYAAAIPKLSVALSGPIRVAGRECAMPLLAELDLGDRTLQMDVIDVMKLDEQGKLVSMRAFWSPDDMRPKT